MSKPFKSIDLMTLINDQLKKHETNLIGYFPATNRSINVSYGPF
jgi:hypothetical protein